MGKHKDVNLQAGDKINLYDKSRDGNHAFHVYQEKADDNTVWSSIRDKDDETLLDTGEPVTAEDVSNLLKGKDVQIGQIDVNDPMIDSLKNRDDVLHTKEVDDFMKSVGADGYEFDDSNGLHHELISDDGKKPFKHYVSDPSLKDHYLLKDIERGDKTLYQERDDKQAARDAENDRKENAPREEEDYGVDDDLPF